MKRIITICTLLVVLFTALLPHASADTVGDLVTADGFPFIDNEANYFYSYKPTVRPQVLGLENHLFTLTASSVTQLLTTKGSGKYFYGSEFSDNGDVYYCGTLKNYKTYSTTKVGICTWNYGKNTFEAKFSTQFSSGKFTASDMIPTKQFRDDTRYFGFVNGTNTGGSTGSVQFWYLNYDA